MLGLSGYEIAEKIYESAKTLVYRGVRLRDQMPVVIKALKHEYPTLKEVSVFRRQYSLTHALDIPGIVRPYSLESCGNQWALILEDFGALSLRDYCKARALDLNTFFSIAIQTAQILSDLHRHRIIHKDIKPANLLINPTTGQVKITDFSVASILPKENQTLISPEELEGTLPYMSPEQTGRMNRGVDYRSDFYSLGITFYQLLTNRLPFDSQDPLELVHCHLAKQPAPPAALDPTIPSVVSEIVMKLLAKMAEDRYQSAMGLQHDLEICHQQFQLVRNIPPFELGQQDYCDRLSISEKLYGRAAEVERVLTAFEQVHQSGRSAFLLISGCPGVGKSCLVQEVYKPLVQQRGYFIAGKFAQLKRNVPYSGITYAFSSLVQQLLTESEARLQQWREKLAIALGAQGQVIVDVIPEIEQIIGKQPAIAALNPAAAQHRFRHVFRNFIRVLCQPTHPIVMFLDDLQWADTATLRLIKLILADEHTRHLFIIGACRDNELTATHPLRLLLEDLRDREVVLHQIALKPLSLEHLTQLLVDTLKTSAIAPLSGLILQKTGGNPFFVNEFLKTLYQDGALWFDFDTKRWQWNLAEIEALNMTDNVVELLIGRLRKLPEATQRLLQLAACIGNPFDLKTLSIVSQDPKMDAAARISIAQALTVAVQQGLIVPMSTPKLVQGHHAEPAVVSTHYKFLHDRVQQAAYALIGDREKQAVHLQIGRLLQANLPISKWGEYLFELVRHLNLGHALLTQTEEQVELAHLNIQAGIKAKQAAAYSVAHSYLMHAHNTLTQVTWATHPELMFTLHREQAELEYLLGNFQRSKQLIELILEHTTAVLEQAEVYRLLIVLYTMQAQYEAAIAVGRTALALLDVEIPATDLAAALTVELACAKYQLGGKVIAELLDQPEMTIPEKRTAVKLLVTLGSAAYCCDQTLWRIAVMKVVNLSLQYGQLPESTYGYSGYGLILGSSLGDYQAGYEFGQLSLKISEKFSSRAEESKVCVVMGESIQHWVKPLKDSADIFAQGYQAGLESGELQFAGYNLGYQILSWFYQGLALETLSSKILNYLEFAHQTQNHYLKDFLAASQLAISALQEADMSSNTASAISELQFLEHCENSSSFAVIGFYKILKAQILFLYDRAPDALACLQDAEAFLSYLSGYISLAGFNFYHSLILLALYPTAPPDQQQQYWQQLTQNQEQMQIWSESCPANFRHQYLLIEAEIARSLDDPLSAIDRYDDAIALAKVNGFVQDCAIANELAAKFWLSRGKTKFAQVYLVEAYYHYQAWGATAKLTDLKQQYAQLLTAQISLDLPFPTEQSLSISTTSTAPAQVLDLATILKASQTISQEIQLDKLLTGLLKVVLESVGAQQGALLLPKQEDWAIAAQGSHDNPEITILPTQPILEQTVPISLIQYVARTEQKLIIQDVANAAICAADPYVLAYQPKSILCFPILHQNKLIGVLYLENRETTQAFSHDRLQVLSLLSAQIAISLENATLYQTLQSANLALQASEARERERAQQLEQSLEELKQTQGQLIQTEKISSLGQLVAGVAHEVNNPVGFIIGNLKHAEQGVTELIHLVKLYRETFPQPGSRIDEEIEAIDLDFLIQDLPQVVNSMKLGTDRIKDIMQSLRIYSRVDGRDKQLADLHKGLDSTLMILSHRLKATPARPAIQIIKHYGEIPDVPCFAGQLNQVFMNLIANAIDALEESSQGKSYLELEATPSWILIRTSIENHHAVIRIQDNGPGMPPKVQQQAFEAFFTTKPEGKGTGLGLSICYQIIHQQHGGQLSLVSQLGEGTEFVIQIPLR